jgi:small subunit ribosomal protein S9
MAVATQYATGRRKCAVARAWVTGAAGDITINDKPLEQAFPRLTLRQIIQLPLELAGVAGKYSIKATVHGGGPTGQAGAIRHAIARALATMNQPLRAPLKKEGLLTRDSRIKERKKYGQKGARKRFQYSKR